MEVKKVQGASKLASLSMSHCLFETSIILLLLLLQNETSCLRITAMAFFAFISWIISPRPDSWASRICFICWPCQHWVVWLLANSWLISVCCHSNITAFWYSTLKGVEHLKGDSRWWPSSRRGDTDSDTPRGQFKKLFYRVDVQSFPHCF